MSLDFFWSGVDMSQGEEVPGLTVVGEDRLSFGVDKFLVGEGSISTYLLSNMSGSCGEVVVIGNSYTTSMYCVVVFLYSFYLISQKNYLKKISQ